MTEIPVFALLGHPNEGKSSVVSTLTEDDHVPVSVVPGETRECTNYAIVVDNKTLLRFVDTPGFQMPIQTLSWMKQYNGPPERMIEEFIQVHQNDACFADDCELLRPVAKNSGIIYVVDGSRPLRSNDDAEMEILRLSGRPRMAVLNSKESETAYVSQWKSAFSKTFNVNFQFNAHQATFNERIDLLQALQPIEQDWSPAIAKAIEVLKENWTARLEACADSILHLLDNTISHCKNSISTESDPSEREKQRTELVEEFKDDIAHFEKLCQRELKSRFLHNVFNADLVAESVVAETLYSEETWTVLGATHRQLIIASIISGALSGSALDVFFANLTFGVFTTAGGVLGGIAGWKGTRPLACSKLKFGPFSKKLGGYSVTVGPMRNPQLCFVLLDRALIYFQCVSNWAHARRESGVNSELEGKQGFVAFWEKDKRKAFEKYIGFSRAKKKEKVDKLRPTLREILVQTMRDA